MKKWTIYLVNGDCATKRSVDRIAPFYEDEKGRIYDIHAFCKPRTWIYEAETPELKRR